ncbi:MAG: FAD synthetase family protein [Treponema sp.]|jgi:riboflavin kinase/FMN adenylyltransferase|nr:FAD synthetase family protein [Treponema sp.]
MRILNWEDFTGAGGTGEPGEERPGALSIGVFDGVHRGHQRLIEKIVLHSRENNSVPMVITFRQSPRRILSPASWHGDIYSLRQKLAILESLGVEEAVLIDFSGNFSRMSGKEFVDLLNKRRKIGYLAVGANFRCGHRLDTGAGELGELVSPWGVEFEAVPPVMAGEHPVSSSRIRRAISEGDMGLASELLGRPFAVDLEGLPFFKSGGFCWDLRAASRIVPRPGRYPALLRQGPSDRGIKTVVSVDQGRLLVDGGSYGGGGIFVEFGRVQKPLGFQDFLNGS